MMRRKTKGEPIRGSPFVFLRIISAYLRVLRGSIWFLAALREATYMALRATLGLLQLRSAVGTGSHEGLIAVHALEFVLCLRASGRRGRIHDSQRRCGLRRCITFEQLLLNPLLLPHPALDGDADCVGH